MKALLTTLVLFLAVGITGSARADDPPFVCTVPSLCAGGLPGPPTDEAPQPGDEEVDAGVVPVEETGEEPPPAEESASDESGSQASDSGETATAGINPQLEPPRKPRVGYCMPEPVLRADGTWGRFVDLEVDSPQQDRQWSKATPAPHDSVRGAHCDEPAEAALAAEPEAQPATQQAQPKANSQKPVRAIPKPVSKLLRQTKSIAPPPRESPGVADTQPTRSRTSSASRSIAPPPIGPPKGP